ncbi:glycosyltransferase family 2 protein [Sphingobacterium sp. Mn56C]|uniref:glycosyltransferase family 2 protein n=1 Tax=Sphingobacterium sp. Mn56C TaxID=3395261 RepID=UPI003BD5B0CA
MFSVVIPLYNKFFSIEKTIFSVLKQSYKNFEIIVVNDGSTDNSLEIVQNIPDKRIKIIDKPNGGVSSARNVGIQNSKFEWVCFLDGDDLWEPEKLQKYFNAICLDETVNWIFSGYYVVKKNQLNPLIFKNGNGRIENVFDSLLDGIKIHTSTVAVRKHLFYDNEDLWFSLGINNSEDREVWYKLSCIDKSPYYLGEPLSMYLLDDVNSLTKNKGYLSKNHFLSMRDRLDGYLNRISLSDRSKLCRYIELFNENAIIQQWRNGQIDDSLFKYIGKKRKIMEFTNGFPILLKKVLYEFW